MDNVNKFYEFISNYDIDSETVANLLLNYHGNQLISDEFIEFVKDEGYDI